MLGALFREQVLLGDGQLFLLGVAGQLDDLHPVPQRVRNAVQGMCGGDEEDLAQIEIQVEVMIPEGVVLLGIEDFQQRRRGIAAHVRAELVHLVEDEDGVHRPGLLDAH